MTLRTTDILAQKLGSAAHRYAASTRAGLLSRDSLLDKETRLIATRVRSRLSRFYLADGRRLSSVDPDEILSLFHLRSDASRDLRTRSMYVLLTPERYQQMREEQAHNPQFLDAFSRLEYSASTARAVVEAFERRCAHAENGPSFVADAFDRGAFHSAFLDVYRDSSDACSYLAELVKRSEQARLFYRTPSPVAPSESQHSRFNPQSLSTLRAFHIARSYQERAYSALLLTYFSASLTVAAKRKA